MHHDPRDDQKIYLSGRHEGHGSVMKYLKRNGRLDWWATFPMMTNIRAFVQPENEDHMYMCGDYFENESVAQDDFTLAEYSATIFRLQNDGKVRWYATASGTNAGGGYN